MKKSILLLFSYLFMHFVVGQETIKDLLDLEGYYQHLSGNVLIATDTFQLTESYGLADMKKGLANEINIPSDIGSISKQFTAAAILHLVRDEVLNLDDPINKHLGSYASQKWKKITIHHLLSHTSGIPSLFQTEAGMKDVWPSEEAIALLDLVDYFKNKKLNFRPGKKYSYSNSGYVLLAAIIEQKSGMSYEAFLEKQIFRRYGLNYTSFGPPHQDLFAYPYFGYRRDLTIPAMLFHPSWMVGAGGIYSTVSDLSKWVDIITSDDFLTQKLRASFFGKHVAKRGGYYAYGWDLKTDIGTVEHDGTNFGYISYLGFNPESNEKVILLTNQSYASVSDLGTSGNYILDIKNKIWGYLEGSPLQFDLPDPKYNSFDSLAFDLEGRNYLLKPLDSIYQIYNHQELSLTRVAQAYPIEDTDEMEKRLIRISNALLDKKFRRLRSDCDKQMKVAVRLGIISLGFRMITSDIGKVEKASPYFVNEENGIIRFEGTEGMMDLIVYFDKEGMMQGLFEHGTYETAVPPQLIAYPISDQELFVDGFPYKEQSVRLKIVGQQVMLEQLNRTFAGKLVSE